MTPRDYIGKTFIVKRADDLCLEDEVMVHDITTGLLVATPVMSLALVGDDVEVNEGDPHYQSFSTSQGNPVLVEVRESP